MNGEGIAARPTVTRVGNGYQVLLQPLDPRARELIPDQPIVGYGSTELEAKMDASTAFVRALNKLTPEERKSLAVDAIDDDAQLLARVDDDGATPA